jgi:hypothetical protein
MSPQVTYRRGSIAQAFVSAHTEGVLLVSHTEGVTYRRGSIAHAVVSAQLTEKALGFSSSRARPSSSI